MTKNIYGFLYPQDMWRKNKYVDIWDLLQRVAISSDVYHDIFPREAV